VAGKADVDFSQQPVGLLPDSVILAATGAKGDAVKLYREANGIARYSISNNPRFPSKEGSFTRFIDKWGVEAARAWLHKHARNLLPYFEFDVKIASAKERFGAEVASQLKLKPVTVAVRFSPPIVEETPAEKRAHQRELDDAMAKFLASGGKKTTVPAAGWAAGKDDVGVGHVFVRSTGKHARSA
jgi:hypothetical protein